MGGGGRRELTILINLDNRTLLLSICASLVVEYGVKIEAHA